MSCLFVLVSRSTGGSSRVSCLLLRMITKSTISNDLFQCKFANYPRFFSSMLRSCFIPCPDSGIRALMLFRSSVSNMNLVKLHLHKQILAEQADDHGQGRPPSHDLASHHRRANVKGNSDGRNTDMISFVMAEYMSYRTKSGLQGTPNSISLQELLRQDEQTRIQSE